MSPSKFWESWKGGLGRKENRPSDTRWWPTPTRVEFRYGDDLAEFRKCAFCQHFRLNGMQPGAHLYKGELHASDD